ncbi:MAG: TauD/TfdA family dioxygenase [Proteobacteria bacterium]|nr:TauD/TfdA family dioxygenase [Pseudomonadota bacterium]
MLKDSVRDVLPARLPAEPLKPVVDPAEWTGADLAASDDWKFVLTADEIAELDDAVAGVEARGLQIKDIALADFPLPTLDPKLARLKDQLMEGRGLGVLRGVPVDRYTIEQSAIAYWGIGLRVGTPVSQNRNGHLLGHVYDLVGPSRENPAYRAYHTSADLGYHSDSCDVVALLCLRKAKTGGLSKIVSTVAVYNEILRRRPDLAAELIKPWYIDRREEIPPGKEPWFQMPVFCFAKGYFSTNWHNFYVRSAQRFAELPRFTEAQIEALELLDVVAEELRCDMAFEPGDIQFLHNHVTAHGRTIYQDWPEPERKRHLLRLWLATPGGRPLVDDILERYVGLKPGQRPAGIVVEGMALTTPLEPE